MTRVVCQWCRGRDADMAIILTASGTMITRALGSALPAGCAFVAEHVCSVCAGEVFTDDPAPWADDDATRAARWASLGRTFRFRAGPTSAACDRLWLLLLVTEDSDAHEWWARELHAIDGVARHVPGDTHDHVWTGVAKTPCPECYRYPHAGGCPRGGMDDANH